MRSRHELVWLTPTGWAQVSAQAQTQTVAEPDRSAAIERWRDKDWPLVVRRRESAMTATELGLGLPLPPDAHGSKLRFAFTIDARGVARWQAPITLAEALQAAPARWQQPLQALLADCTRAAAALPGSDGGAALVPRIFGSLAMQAITGQSYVRPNSDLDLLVAPASAAALQAALLLLRRHGQFLPLDGEIVFPGARAVAWRELDAAAATTRVLVKSADSVQLVPRAELVASLETPC